MDSHAITEESKEHKFVTSGLTIGYASGGDLVSWFFQFAFAATAATIVAGTVAERCKFEAYIGHSLALTGFVYPVVVRSIWSSNGFLSETTIDIAGLISNMNDDNGWWAAN